MLKLFENSKMQMKIQEFTQKPEKTIVPIIQIISANQIFIINPKTKNT